MTFLLLWLLLINWIPTSDQQCSMTKIDNDDLLSLSFQCVHTNNEDFLDDFYVAHQAEQWPAWGKRPYYALEITDSNFSSITQFNSPLPYSTIYLYSLKITNSLVESIDEDAFQTLTDLRVLSLSNNKLTNLDFLKFVPRNLNKLYLNGNAFETGSITFSNLIFTNYLNISECNVSTIYSNGFTANDINMSKNKIQNINDVLPIFPKSYLTSRNWNLSFNDFKNEAVLRPSKKITINNLILSHSNIEVIDPQMFTNLMVMDLIEFSGNNIRYLQSYTFKNCKCKSLNLYNSSINDIEANTFNGASAAFLNISHNSISILRDHVFNNTNFVEIDLSNSGLKQIQSNAFLGLNYFQSYNFNKLILAKNQITFLASSTFQELITINEIDLSFNAIKEISLDLFKNCKQLEKVDLSNNLILKLSQSTFESLIKVNMLDLSNNQLSELAPYMFDNISVIKLSLKNNNISLLENNVFNKMQSLTKLDLSGVKCLRIESDSFVGLTNLEELNLKGNTFLDIPSTAFADLNQLQRLDLTGNSLPSLHSPLIQTSLKELNLTFENVLPKNLFIKLNNLETLNIVNSNGSIKRGDFKGLVNLKTINFYNVIVQEIESGSFIGLNSLVNINEQLWFKNITLLRSNQFRGLWHLYSLNLSNSHIADIEPDCFKGLRNLGIVLLHGNKIKTLVAHSFDGLLSLTTLNLSYNLINNIEVESFKGLESLLHLSLANNNLSSIFIGTFQILPHLETLQLQRNNIKKLTSGVFSNLKKLVTLDLSYNSISVFEEQIFFSLKSLEYLDFTYNNLIRINYELLLRLLPSVKYIGINFNKWKCKGLDLMLSAFYKQHINWITDQYVYDVENVDGVFCIDDCKYIHCAY